MADSVTTHTLLDDAANLLEAHGEESLANDIRFAKRKFIPDVPVTPRPEGQDARARIIAECREALLDLGKGAHEAAKAKDATDYVAGYQDCAVDADEALRALLRDGSEPQEGRQPK